MCPTPTKIQWRGNLTLQTKDGKTIKGKHLSKNDFIITSQTINLLFLFFHQRFLHFLVNTPKPMFCKYFYNLISLKSYGNKNCSNASTTIYLWQNHNEQEENDIEIKKIKKKHSNFALFTQSNRFLYCIVEIFSDLFQHFTPIR